MLAISYITAHFLFASAKYLFTQNCKAPSGVEIFDGFSQSELKQDADLARRDLAKDAKIARRRAYAFDSLRLSLSILKGEGCSLALRRNNDNRKSKFLNFERSFIPYQRLSRRALSFSAMMICAASLK